MTCHNARLKTAGLAIDQLDLARVDRHAETWEKVARKLRTHEMPPPGTPRPDKAGYERAAAALEAALDAAAAARPQPGRVAVHRLNRTEYANAIRDLLALDVDVKALLPADEPDQQGFDNMASVLSVSPRLLENYLSAAAVVSRLAVGDVNASPTEDTFRIPTAMVQDSRAGDDLPFGSRGGTSIRYQFPVDGEYGIKVLLRRQLYLYLIGMGEPQQIDIRVDGVLVKRFSVGGEGKGTTAPESFAGNTQGDPAWEVYMHTADDGLSVRVPVKAGTHRVGVSFVRRAWEPEGILHPPQRGFARTTNELYFGDAAVESVTIAGPYRPALSDDTASRRAVFVCRPASPSSEDACARRIFSGLARRAYRRPVSADDVERLMTFYRAGRAEDGFDDGVQRGLRRLLSSPAFLFRVEAVPARTRPGQAYRIGDVDLASRLSFFLWSSVPDDELLSLAARGALSNPAALERQVRRMLADPRASALVENFASQWLSLGKLAGLVPDADAYPEFDENLRDAFRRETQLFVADQLRRDRGVPELVTADYSFINERLARHYRIANVYGSHFRRITFPDGTRGGLLGQGSVLAVTSYPNRTSPVVRGRWLLENILGAPPPAPPPDVPSLPEHHGRRARAFDSRADGGASPESGVRGVPRSHGSAGVLAGELRRAREVADRERRQPRGCLGSSARWHGVPRRHRAAPAARGPRDRVRADVRREADGLRARARGGRWRSAGRAGGGARCRTRRASLVRRHPRRGDERPLHDGCGRVAAACGAGWRGGDAFESGGASPMMITRKAIPRRAMLRGLGATLALPLLDSMVPALTAMRQTAARPATRFGVMYVPNGMIMDQWTPAAEGAGYELTPTLSPLAPHRKDLLVLSQMACVPTPGRPGGAHAKASTRFLTDVSPPTSETWLDAGISIDQILARELGGSMQAASLELAVESSETAGACDVGFACAYTNTLSWLGPATPLPTENNPRVVFERLFGDSRTTDARARAARLREDRSVLDSVRDELATLQSGIGPGDRAKLAEYLQSVRDVERRIQAAESRGASELPVIDRPAGIPGSYQDHVRLMCDLQVLAYQTDVTRVVTFMLGREFSGVTYPQIGVPDAHHPITHHQQEAEKIAKVVKINHYHVTQFAYLLERMRSTPDGDGSLLDHSMLMYGAGIGECNAHDPRHIPLLLAGGASGHLKGGRHIKYPKETPLANLHLTLLDTLGVRLDRIGDSTGRLDDKVLSGLS